jgi:two-component system chemotaxis response regulator CheY
MIPQRLRLLIVEDSALIRKMYELAFSPRDHDLVEAANGRQALDALAASPVPFDVILLDLRMPDMNGVEIILAVRATRFADIPIVVTTAERETSELLQQARELGVAAVVAKPWKPQDLVKTVESVRSAGQA